MKPQSDETVCVCVCVCGWTNGDQNKAWSIKGRANWLVGSHHYAERQSEAEKQSQYAGDCGDRIKHTAPVYDLR